MGRCALHHFANRHIEVLRIVARFGGFGCFQEALRFLSIIPLGGWLTWHGESLSHW